MAPILKFIEFSVLISIILTQDLLALEIPPNCHRNDEDESFTPRIFKDVTGEIFSPGFTEGEPYPEEIVCSWLISVDGANSYVLSFDEMDVDETMGCDGDQVAIGPIINYSPAIQYVLCGKNRPNDIYIASSAVSVVFGSDFIFSGRGFRLKYRAFNSQNVGPQNYQCQNREWIDLAKVCDGKMDCLDGSDEALCGKGTEESEEKFECGIAPHSRIGSDNLVARMMGGELSTEGSWPWQVTLQNSMIEPFGHYCGGVLIHPQYVITAAHCIASNPRADLIRIGLGYNRGFNPNGHEQIRFADSYIIHPNVFGNVAQPARLSSDDFDRNNDVALIKLNAPVQITDYVKPICLDSKIDPPEDEHPCYVTGWGRTKGTGHSSSLKQLKVKFVDQKICNIEDDNELSSSNLICIQSDVPGVGPCSGDSGGPLQCKIDGHWQLFGVADRVLAATGSDVVCGLYNGGALYYNVMGNREWVKKAMEAM
ncbi:chymotrypsin-like elastase family member 2B [Brevipalpus obovatus]|uniref:chymotrypsin-like elastase family member 2B n=1 Tax=Brevipalpus obovatus TaxID=246614 RepID=UPI003D9F238A